MNTLSSLELENLSNLLLYLKVNELRELCELVGVPSQAKKIVLVENILLYMQTGKVPEIKKIPLISKAQPRASYPLARQTLMMYGSFKNDLKTRLFLKSLIGNHFHYTAFGLDWIEKRWLQGKPPTYAEFAHYWQSEYEARQLNKGALKPEWAYLNFLDNYKKVHPAATKNEAIAAWGRLRSQNVAKVKEILKNLCLKIII